MPYPATALPYVTELLINGAWVDVTADVRDSDIYPGPQIARGRADESARVSPSTCQLTLSNKTGVYSNRLPTSPYYGVLGRNTQIRHRLRWAYSTFSGTASNGWAPLDSGQVWTITGGTSADYSESGGTSRHMLPSVSISRNSIVALPVQAPDVVADVSASQVATGDIIYGGPGFGDGTTNNMYQARLQYRTDSTVWLQIIKRVASVESSIAGPVQVGTYTAGRQFTARLQWRPGGLLRASAWLSSSPPTATSWLLSVTDTDLTVFTSAVMRSIAGSGNTNVGAWVSYDDFEANSWRFWGEIPAWPQAWDVSGADVTAPIEAAGIMRRLTAGAKPLQSAMFRGIPATHPLAWWPLETDAKSGLAGGLTMGQSGQVNFGANSGHPGSAPLPDYTGGGLLTARLPNGAVSNSWRVEFTARFGTGSNSVSDFTAVLDVNSPNGDVNAWEFFVTDALTIPGAKGAAFQWANIGASYTGAIQTDALVDDGQWHHFRADVAQSGGNISVTLTIDGTVRGTSTLVGKNLNSTDSSVVINPLRQKAAEVGAVGHVTWWSAYTPTSVDTAVLATGNAGETAGARLIRLCGEEGVALDVVGDPTDTPQMGPQATDTLLANLQSCADVDQGILGEPRDAFGLLYRTNHSMLNQVGPSLDYSAGRLAPPLLPTEDDQLVRNSVTATRPGGSSATVEATTGSLSTQNPPLGIGLYDTQITVNTYTDAQLAHEAGWQVRLGTWDEARYPQVNVNFARLLADGQIALAGQVASLDIGDYYAITNPPSWLPPDAIELLAQGYRETHRGFEWAITYNSVPAGPYNAFVVGDPVRGRLDTDGSWLASGVNSAATMLLVTTTTRLAPQWVLSGDRPGDFPFDIGIGGERLRVTATDYGMSDSFTRTLTGTWGTSSSGDTYTLSGTAANFNVNGTRGTIGPTATGSDRLAYVPVADSGRYRRGQVDIRWDALPASGDLRSGLILRLVDANNFIVLAASIVSTGGLSLIAYKRVAGVLTTVATQPISWITVAPNTDYRLTAYLYEGEVWAAIWPVSGGTPTPVLFIGDAGSDVTTGAGSGFGVYARDASASATHLFSYDTLRLLSPQDFVVTRSINGVAKAQTSGTAVSLWRPSALSL